MEGRHLRWAEVSVQWAVIASVCAVLAVRLITYSIAQAPIEGFIELGAVLVGAAAAVGVMIAARQCWRSLRRVA
jgi:hypothetical protein